MGGGKKFFDKNMDKIYNFTKKCLRMIEMTIRIEILGKLHKVIQMTRRIEIQGKFWVKLIFGKMLGE